MLIALRGYQEKGIEDLRVCFKQGFRAPLYVLPTGGGKTITFAAIAEGAEARGKRVLILEHRKELIRQTSVTLGSLGVKHQVIAPDNKLNGIRAAHVRKFGWPMISKDSHVAVASVQTLGRRMDWLAEFDPDLIIIDEAHHAVAGTWAKIIAACPRSLLLGVTATPVRADGKGLGIKHGGPFDCIVFGPSMKELIAGGFLCQPRVVVPPNTPDLSSVGHRGKDLDPDEQAKILDVPDITGDAVEHYRRLASGKSAIVFCTNLKHAGHVAEAFRAGGYRFEVIHGGMDDDERDRLIYGLADGSIQGLVSVDLIGEGVDIPVAEVAILLRKTESLGLFLQQVGRVLRLADGKEFGLIIDHVGNCGRIIDGVFVSFHGLPQQDREWSLDGVKKKKRGAREVKQEEAVQCPTCYSPHDPAPKCPFCGHVYAVRAGQLPSQGKGTLIEVSEDLETALKIEARRAQGQAKTADQLIQQGISNGRAEKILAARREKDDLKANLRILLERWRAQDGRTVLAGWGFMMAEINSMKPKQLRETIERVNEALLSMDPNAGMIRIRNAI